MVKTEKIGFKKMKEILIAVAEEVIKNTDYLTDLDRACGDGDFGVGMYRGFTNAKNSVQAYKGNDIGELFAKMGSAIMSSVGGASGPVFGTLFSTTGMKLKGKTEVGLKEFADALKASSGMIANLGKVQKGDKTMFDALAPAVEVLQAATASGLSLKESFEKAAEVAERSAEATKEMVARKGKASYLGEKTIGYIDPGAATIALIFKTISGKL